MSIIIAIKYKSFSKNNTCKNEYTVMANINANTSLCTLVIVYISP